MPLPSAEFSYDSVSRAEGSSRDTNTTSVVLECGYDQILAIFGPNEEMFPFIADRLAATVSIKGNRITLRGTPSAVQETRTIMLSLFTMGSNGHRLEKKDIETVISHDKSVLKTKHLSVGLPADPEELFTGIYNQENDSLMAHFSTRKGKHIRAKTPGQREYVTAIERDPLVFGLGPAGTGKTFLAVASAVKALELHEVRRIIITRPAVEAGESLGFLPGSLSEKIDPYLRPIFDALSDVMDAEIVTKLLASSVIEIAPLAYMRGRTLNDAFIILDEAQNTTKEQMKMFVTRLGTHSKMVITGDVTQIDLKGRESGLITARQVLKDVAGVSFIDLSSSDIVRHKLVADIVRAYDEHER